MKKLVNRFEKVFGMYETVDPTALIELRNKIAATLPAELASKITFEIDSETYPYDPSEYYGLYMKWQDYETDTEYKKRVAQETKNREAQEKRERAEFERLSKKFK